MFQLYILLKYFFRDRDMKLVTYNVAAFLVVDQTECKNVGTKVSFHAFFKPRPYSSKDCHSH